MFYQRRPSPLHLSIVGAVFLLIVVAFWLHTFIGTTGRPWLYRSNAARDFIDDVFNTTLGASILFQSTRNPLTYLSTV